NYTIQGDESTMDLRNLKESIEKLKSSENVELSYHDIHHYTLSYVLVTMMTSAAVAGVVWRYRRRRRAAAAAAAAAARARRPRLPRPPVAPAAGHTSKTKLARRSDICDLAVHLVSLRGIRHARVLTRYRLVCNP
ncbi:hypothetical protein JYU34_011999, partial [Plutella xylostella]